MIQSAPGARSFAALRMTGETAGRGKPGPYEGDGLPHQCAHWLARTGRRGRGASSVSLAADTFRLAAFVVCGQALRPARKQRGCGNTGLAFSATGSARPVFPVRGEGFRRARRAWNVAERCSALRGRRRRTGERNAVPPSCRRVFCGLRLLLHDVDVDVLVAELDALGGEALADVLVQVEVHGPVIRALAPDAHHVFHGAALVPL